MRRFTNKAANWRGDTIIFTVRIPKPVADEIDARIGQEGLPNRSAIAQDALAQWVMREEDRENGHNGSGPSGA